MSTSNTTFQKFFADQINELPDEFTQSLFAGSLRVLDDQDNPTRLHLFSAGLRELFHDLLKLFAPDNEVLSSEWCETKKAKDISKRQRAKYAIQGGIKDEYLVSLGISADDLDKLRQDLVNTINKTNALLHFHDRELVSEPEKIERTADGMLEVLFHFLQTIEECKLQLSRNVEKHVFDALKGAFPDKVFENRDRAVKRYLVPLWGDIEDEICEITNVSSDKISVRFTANVEIDIETSSFTDFNSQNGMFPVELAYTAPVSDITKLEIISSNIDEEAPVWLQTEEDREELEMQTEIARLIEKDERLERRNKERKSIPPVENP